jgi:hypothetical protein
MTISDSHLYIQEYHKAAYWGRSYTCSILLTSHLHQVILRSHSPMILPSSHRTAIQQMPLRTYKRTYSKFNAGLKNGE